MCVVFGFPAAARKQPAHGNAFFCCRGGRVLARSVRNFALFVPRSVSPSDVRLSVLVPRSVFKHLMFKRAFRSPPAFRVPTHKKT